MLSTVQPTPPYYLESSTKTIARVLIFKVAATAIAIITGLALGASIAVIGATIATISLIAIAGIIYVARQKKVPASAQLEPKN